MQSHVNPSCQSDNPWPIHQSSEIKHQYNANPWWIWQSKRVTNSYLTWEQVYCKDRPKCPDGGRLRLRQGDPIPANPGTIDQSNANPWLICQSSANPWPIWTSLSLGRLSNPNHASTPMKIQCQSSANPMPTQCQFIYYYVLSFIANPSPITCQSYQNLPIQHQSGDQSRS